MRIRSRSPSPLPPCEGAAYSAALGEFVLPYDTVRTARDPEAHLLAFLEATYVAASRLGGWNVAMLETGYGRPGIPRAI